MGTALLRRALLGWLLVVLCITELPLAQGADSAASPIRRYSCRSSPSLTIWGIGSCDVFELGADEKPEIVMAIPLPTEKTPNTLEIAEAMGRTVQQLVEGKSILSVGIPDVNYLEKRPLRPIIHADYLEGQIIFIDSFENIVVNIRKEHFEEQRIGRPFQILFRRDETIDRISESYADVASGDKLALFNSAGYLEIAINKGNAAGLFGLKGYAENMRQSQLAYQTVRIVFG